MHPEHFVADMPWMWGTMAAAPGDIMIMPLSIRDKSPSMSRHRRPMVPKVACSEEYMSGAEGCFMARLTSPRSYHAILQQFLQIPGDGFEH